MRLKKGVLRKIFAKIEVFRLKKWIQELESGEYYLKHATIEDLAKILDIDQDLEEFDGLVYRRQITGYLGNRRVIINVWSSTVSVVRLWVSWS